MQDLTASPRDALTAEQVKALLNADDLEVDPGIELLDTSDKVVADLSEHLLGGEVERQNYADAHGTVRLSLSYTLNWASDRVRPYVTLRGAGHSARFNLGVYILQIPERSLGDDIETYDVSGVDKMSLLQVPVGDTYVANPGVTYIDAVKAAISAAGAGTRVNIGGDAVGQTLATPMVWALTDEEPATWIRVVNDLLAKVGYSGLWADHDGNYRSGPYVSPRVRHAEWDLTVDDPRTSLVSEDRMERRDSYEAVNTWRFVMRDAETTPAAGAGIYDITNLTEGPYARNVIGRALRKTLYLDAATQASLQAQGDAIVQGDLQFSRTLEVNTAPLPQAGHFDVMSFTDAALGGTLHTQARSWTLPLNGDDMTWTLEVL